MWSGIIVLQFMGHFHKMLSITKQVASKIMSYNKSKDIFLIYARKDEQACDIVFQILTKTGFSVWKDIYELGASDNFTESIKEAIDRAKVIIIIESAWIKENPYIQKEIKYAEQQSKKIIHIFTNNVDGQKSYRRMTFHVDFEMNDILFEEKLIFNLLTKGCVPNTKYLFEKGEELYKKARRGETIERKEREVEINKIELLSITKEKILFKVDCSKGTYIRTLGLDIANKLDYPGHLTHLVRTRVGRFFLKDAKDLEDISEKDIIPISTSLSHLPSIKVNDQDAFKVKNGVKLLLQGADLYFIMDKNSNPLAIYKRKEDGYYYSLRGLF